MQQPPNHWDLEEPDELENYPSTPRVTPSPTSSHRSDASLPAACRSSSSGGSLPVHQPDTQGRQPHKRRRTEEDDLPQAGRSDAHPAKRCYIQDLPADVLLRILRALSVPATVSSLMVCRRWRDLLRQRRQRSAHLDVCLNLTRLAPKTGVTATATAGVPLPAVRWLGTYAHLLARVRVKGHAGSIGAPTKIARLLAGQLPALLGMLSARGPGLLPVPVQLELTGRSPFEYWPFSESALPVEGPGDWWTPAFLANAAPGILALHLRQVVGRVPANNMELICQLTGLQELEMVAETGSSILHADGVPGELSQLTALTRLKLHGGQQDLWTLDCISNLHRLQELSVACHIVAVEQPAGLAALTQLTALRSTCDEGNLVAAAAAHCTGLRRLTGIEAGAFEALAQALPGLRSLEVLEVRHGQLPDLEPFLAANTALQELHLEHCGLQRMPRNLAAATALRSLRLGSQADAQSGGMRASALFSEFDWGALLRLPALRSVAVSTELACQDANVIHQVHALNAAYRAARPELEPDAELARIVVM